MALLLLWNPTHSPTGNTTAVLKGSTQDLFSFLDGLRLVISKQQAHSYGLLSKTGVKRQSMPYFGISKIQRCQDFVAVNCCQGLIFWCHRCQNLRIYLSMKYKTEIWGYIFGFTIWWSRSQVCRWTSFHRFRGCCAVVQVLKTVLLCRMHYKVSSWRFSAYV